MSIGDSMPASSRPIGAEESGPSLIACSSIARFSAPAMTIMIARAEVSAGAVRVTRSTGAVLRHRIGPDADGAALARAGDGALEVGAGEDPGGVAVGAHAEAGEVERPAEQRQPGVGEPARLLAVAERRLVDQRDELGAPGGEIAFELAIVAERVAERRPAGRRSA